MKCVAPSRALEARHHAGRWVRIWEDIGPYHLQDPSVVLQDWRDFFVFQKDLDSSIKKLSQSCLADQ